MRKSNSQNQNKAKKELRCTFNWIGPDVNTPGCGRGIVCPGVSLGTYILSSVPGDWVGDSLNPGGPEGNKDYSFLNTGQAVVIHKEQSQQSTPHKVGLCTPEMSPSFPSPMFPLSLSLLMKACDCESGEGWDSGTVWWNHTRCAHCAVCSRIGGLHSGGSTGSSVLCFTDSLVAGAVVG